MAKPVVSITAQAPAIRAPVELRVAYWFTGIFALGLLWGLPANLPDADSLVFVHKHYFGPLLLAFAINVPIVWLAGRRNPGDPLLLVRLTPFLALVLLLHFNFKAWMPLVHPTSFDQAYQQMDEFLWPVVLTMCRLREVVAQLVPLNMDQAYHGMFVAMFFAAFAAHAVWDTPTRQRQLVLGMCLILLVGGLCYWIGPAVGPFLFRPSLNEESAHAQAHMLAMFQTVVATGQIPNGYFTAPLAAMPSLHVAHALFFTLFARQSLRPLFWLFLPLTGWIVIESVASGWHYLADLPVGAGIAYVVYKACGRWLPEPCGVAQSETVAGARLS